MFNNYSLFNNLKTYRLLRRIGQEYLPAILESDRKRQLPLQVPTVIRHPHELRRFVWRILLLRYWAGCDLTLEPANRNLISAGYDKPDDFRYANNIECDYCLRAPNGFLSGLSFFCWTNPTASSSATTSTTTVSSHLPVRYGFRYRSQENHYGMPGRQPMTRPLHPALPARLFCPVTQIDNGFSGVSRQATWRSVVKPSTKCCAKFDLSSVQTMENDHLQRRRPVRQLFLNSPVSSPARRRTSLEPVLFQDPVPHIVQNWKWLDSATEPAPVYLRRRDPVSVITHASW